MMCVLLNETVYTMLHFTDSLKARTCQVYFIFCLKSWLLNNPKYFLYNMIQRRIYKFLDSCLVGTTKALYISSTQREFNIDF